MNILISSGPQNNNAGKLVQNTDMASAIGIASSLGYFSYGCVVYNDQLIVNDVNGVGYGFTLNESSINTRYFVFDTNESSVLSWISTNHPTATILNFSKSNITVQ